MKSLSTGKIWLFAMGQFGWSLLSGLISNWLVYFYQPDEASIAQGQSLSMLLFTAVSTIGTASGTGYRVAAFGAALFCILGGVIFLFYNERKINQSIS